MNIAITSFIKSENYGALLQSFALQRAIEKLGHKAVYLDYERNPNFTVIQRLKNTAYRIIRVFFGYHKRKYRTDKFVNDFISVEKFVDEEQYDIYVSGSDQVWHPDYVNDFFFLNFVKKAPKISYASSFGVSNIDDRLYDYYTSSLSNFLKLSIRENKGIDILKKLKLNDYEVVIDPTLLLSPKEWDSCIEKIHPYSSKYILCYVMSGDSIMAKYISRIANHLNESLGGVYKVITLGDKEYKKIKPGYHLDCSAGPLEFISYIKHADYVITSSFHGTCFSIIYNKKFFSILRNGNPLNCRIEDTLSLLGLNNCKHYNTEKIESYSFAEIEYDNVNRLLNNERCRCVNFLQSFFEEYEATRN